VRCWISLVCIRLRISAEFQQRVEAKSQKPNPPQSPLVRGEANHPPLSGVEGGANTPHLTRGGREGLLYLPYDKKLTALARENRSNPTPAEHKMWREVLSRNQFSGCKCLRQKPIKYFIVDFYCVQLRWVIEFDGDSHGEQISYDEKRTSLLQQHGLTVIRYDNHDVLNNIAGVYDDLMRRLG